MASKQNIKEIINLLCKIINHHGATKLTPETFRVAKFNKDEATGPMWRLLFETNRFVNCGSFESVEGNTEEKKRDIVQCTKHEMFSRGYFVKDFFILPEDMRYGSRDILLAFGWLLTRGAVLEILLKSCSNLLEECLPLNKDSAPTSVDPIGNIFGKNSQELTKTLNLADELSNLEQLPWMLGNLRLTCNGLYSTEQRLVSLTSKVHHDTLGTDNRKGHLSTLEVYLLRHPKELVKFQEKLQRYNLYLENLLKFIEHQVVFWKWMESVYEAKITEGKTPNELGCKSSPDWKMCHENGCKELKKISETRLEVEKFLDEGNAFYLQAREMLRRTGEEPCDMSSDCLELKERMKALHLEEASLISKNKPQTFPEFKRLPTSGPTSGNAKHPMPQSCAEQGIKMLRTKISKLEVEVMQMKKLHFETLNNLTSNLEELVCIPPIQTNILNYKLQNK